MQQIQKILDLGISPSLSPVLETDLLLCIIQKMAVTPFLFLRLLLHKYVHFRWPPL